ncbi:GDSL family lipase, partial [Mycobacterium sp. ITM-2017-0098]
PSAAGYELAAKQLLPALCEALGEFVTGRPPDDALETRSADSSSLLSRVGGFSRLWRRSTGVPAPIVVAAG